MTLKGSNKGRQPQVLLSQTHHFGCLASKHLAGGETHHSLLIIAFNLGKKSHDYHMTITQVTHDYHMTITQVSHDYHMTIT